MTVYQLAKLNKVNGGHWFNRVTMKLWKHTLKDFSIKSNPKEKTVTLTNKTTKQTYDFSSVTGRIVFTKTAA